MTTGSVPNGRAIAVLLHQLHEACSRDDAAMTPGTWTYDDKDASIRVVGGDRTCGILVASGGSVGYENARMTIDDADGAAIAATRNRLPDLIGALREAAACLSALEEDRRDHAHLQRLYTESRTYVATLEREIFDLGASAQRHVAEANRLDARISELEGALSRALEVCVGEGAQEQVDALRAVLAQKDAVP